MMQPQFRFFLLLSIALFFNSYNSFSQQIRTYDSTYRAAPGLVGNAQFEYYLNNDGQRVKHGDFIFVREQIMDTSQTNAIYNLWEGQYLHDQKHGDWLYETKKHRVQINEISDVDFDYSIFTEDEILDITYEQDVPVDEILMDSKLYRNKVLQKRLKYFESGVIEGRMHGEFNFFASDENEDIVEISGQVENGLMVGEWEFNYFQDNLQEIRTYNKGVLLQLTKTENGQVVQELEFPISEGLEAALNNEETNVELAGKPLSLNFSDGYPRNSVYIEEQEKGEEVLIMVLAEIFKFDQDYDPSQQLPLGANRGFYPLSSEERNSLNEWNEIIAEFRDNLQELNDLRIDYINLVQDVELQVFLNWAEEQERIEDYIQPWNNILSKEQIEYYNREGLLVDYAHELLSKDTIPVNGDTRIFEYSPEEKGDNFLHYIVDNFEDRNRVADSLIQEFSVRLEKLEIDQEISDLNQEINKKKEEIDSLYDINTGNELIDQNVGRVKSYYNNVIFPEKYEEFPESDELSAQIRAGEELVGQLEILKDIYNTAQDLAIRHEEIDELYTELTFDPFTFSDQVPVRKKKRLYNVVTEEVIEALINRAGRNYSDPASVLKDLQLTLQMQDRLIFLENKNTRRLERRLQRSDSLDERVELLKSL